MCGNGDIEIERREDDTSAGAERKHPLPLTARLRCHEMHDKDRGQDERGPVTDRGQHERADQPRECRPARFAVKTQIGMDRQQREEHERHAENFRLAAEVQHHRRCRKQRRRGERRPPVPESPHQRIQDGNRQDRRDRRGESSLPLADAKQPVER